MNRCHDEDGHNPHKLSFDSPANGAHRVGGTSWADVMLDVVTVPVLKNVQS